MSIQYTVVFDREEDGRVIASVPGIPGCHVYGRTPAEALRRVKRGLRFYLQEIKKQGGRPPRQPRPVAIDVKIAA